MSHMAVRGHSARGGCRMGPGCAVWREDRIQCHCMVNDDISHSREKGDNRTQSRILCYSHYSSTVSTPASILQSRSASSMQCGLH